MKNKDKYTLITNLEILQDLHILFCKQKINGKEKIN